MGQRGAAARRIGRRVGAGRERTDAAPGSPSRALGTIDAAAQADWVVAGPCAAGANGFSLHAALVVPAGQRERLERVCRYVLRPPVAIERLHLADDGRVRLSVRQPWRDGTTDLVFTPLERLERLAVLVRGRGST